VQWLFGLFYEPKIMLEQNKPICGRPNLATCNISVISNITHYKKEQALRNKYSDEKLNSLSEEEINKLPNPLYSFTLAYPNGLKVIREIRAEKFQKGRTIKKTVKPFRGGIPKNKWLPYRHELLTLAKDKAILVGEGEKVADNAIAHGLVCLSLVGSGVKSKSDFTVHHTLFKEAIAHGVKELVYIADNDDPGIVQAIRFYKAWQEFDSEDLDILLLPTRALFKLVGRSPEPKDDFADLVPHLTEDFKELLECLIDLEGDNYTTEILALDHQYEGLFEEEEKKKEKLDKTFEKSDVGSNFKSILSRQFIDEITQPIFTEADRYGKIAEFCANTGIPSSILEKSIKAKLEQNDQIQEIEELSPRIDDLLKIPYEVLDLNRILGDLFYGTIFEESAKNFPTSPMALFTCLLALISGTIGTRRRVVFNKHWIEPCILRVGFVADSGSIKSPVMNMMIQALKKKDRQEYKRYRQELLEFEENEQLPPERQAKISKPIRQKLIIQDATIDGIYRVHQENPKGFLCYADELAGFFERLNKFIKGGDDISRDLELYGGKMVDKIRANKDHDIELERTAVSVLGSLQWSVLEKIFNNPQDSRGISARWILWGGHLPDAYMPDDFIETGLDDILENLVDEILKFTELDLIVSPSAKKVFKKAQHKLFEKRKELSNEQLKLKYSKAKGEILRIAGVLHTWHWVFQTGVADSPTIVNTEIMELAIEATFYYLRQFEYLVIKCTENMMDARLLKILELTKKKGEINASIIRQFIREFKNIPAHEINNLLLLLIEKGQVIQVPNRQGIKIKLK